MLFFTAHVPMSPADSGVSDLESSSSSDEMKKKHNLYQTTTSKCAAVGFFSRTLSARFLLHENISRLLLPGRHR